MKGKGILGLAFLLVLISLVAWGFQLKTGLIVTNMRNPFSWGLYIATFAFFVGIAAGGLIISSSVYLFNIKELKPFTRLASLSAFASIVGAGAMILPDMGRVDRLYNLFLHPNFRSPLIWDVIVITTYAVLTSLSVYFQLLPDMYQEGNLFLAAWCKRRSVEEVHDISRRWSARIAMIGLPVAVLIHTVTAWIFATQVSRNWWHTGALAPDFIAVAVASGTGLVLLVAVLLTGKDVFGHYQSAFKTLSLIISSALVVHFFLMYNDFMVRWWWGMPVEVGPLALTLKRYGLIHALEVILPAFTMIYFFTGKGRNSYGAVLIGLALLFIGVFAHRFLLMPASYNIFPLNLSIPGIGIEGWQYPIALGELRAGLPVFVDFWPYVPSWIEVAITLLPFGLVLLIISFMVQRFDFLPQSK